MSAKLLSTDAPRLKRGTKAKSRRNDPWQHANGDKPAEHGPWLLSYLDVMTLLFSFFVLLFAYEKAQHAHFERIASASATKSGHAVAERSQQTESLPPTTVAAIESMKSQAQAQEARRAISVSASPRFDDEPPAQLKPALAALKHVGQSLVSDAVASEQTAQRLSSVLQEEAARKVIDITRSAKEIRMEISDTIMFDAGSASLKKDGVNVLARLAPILTKQVGTIYVEGHTDGIAIKTAQFPSNWELSAARASTVTRHLIEQGLSADRLRAVGMADRHPRAGNETADGRARNRRVSLVVMFDGAPGGAL